MSVTMNCLRNNISNPNFKGKWSKTEKGNPYYETNSGIKTGAVLSCLQAPMLLFKSGRTGWGLASNVAMMIAGVGCGAVYDYLRNQKAKDAADYIQKVGVEKALDTRKDLAISSRRKVYFDNSSNTKYGAIMGAIAGIPLSILGSNKSAEVYKANNKPMTTGMKIGGLAFAIPVYTLGGYIMGKIANHYINKDAENNA